MFLYVLLWKAGLILGQLPEWGMLRGREWQQLVALRGRYMELPRPAILHEIERRCEMQNLHLHPFFNRHTPNTKHMFKIRHTSIPDRKRAVPMEIR